jgi:hypothetical protein
VRRPGSDREELHTFYDDDPFLSELATFIDAATLGEEQAGPILSSYADAVKTYEMTWAIRWASERTRRPKPAAAAPAVTAPLLAPDAEADVGPVAPPATAALPEPVAAAA